jgi:hypothetical protein
MMFNCVVQQCKRGDEEVVGRGEESIYCQQNLAVVQGLTVSVVHRLTLAKQAKQLLPATAATMVVPACCIS